MKPRIVVTLLICLVFVLGTGGMSFAGHDDKGIAKGTIIKVEPSEVEVTVRDDKGKETRVKTKDTTLKLGDRVVIKDNKVSKEVKPVTGGY